MSEWVAAELQTLGLGGRLTMRLSDRVGGYTLVKLIADGILLAELEHDRSLRRLDRARSARLGVNRPLEPCGQRELPIAPTT